MQSNQPVPAIGVRQQTRSIREGESVILNGGEQRILVKQVKIFNRGQYKGVIYGFSPSFVQQYQGLRVGDEIWFDADDVA